MRRSRKKTPDVPPEPWASIKCADCGQLLPVTPSGPPTLGTNDDLGYVAIIPLDNTDIAAHMLQHST